MRWTRQTAISIATGLVLVVTGAARADAPAPRRVVSLNPSLTAIALALGAGDRLVGVDDFSAQQEPAVSALPRVGGLYDPSLEAVVGLRPDLVVLVPSAEQRDFRARLEGLGIPLLALNPLTLDDVLASIRTLGERLGVPKAGRARAAAIERRRDEVARAAAGRPALRLVFVLQREPLFVVGTGNFIDDMLRAAGGQNVAAELHETYPRAALEWLIAARPELILDAAGDAGDPKAYWSRWPSLPAVLNGNVIALQPGLVTLPGPWLDRALDRLATTLAHAHRPASASEPRP